MKFKIGDWVKTLSGETKKITGFSGEQNSTIIHSDGFMCYASDCELWQPKKGEWCWFWDEGDEDSTTLSKFTTMYKGYYYRAKDKHEEGFDFCEPFIGNLPSNVTLLRELSQVKE